MSCYIQSLSAFFLNIDGMHYRLGRFRFDKCFHDDVLSVLNCHDIICLEETYCSYSDNCDLELNITHLWWTSGKKGKETWWRDDCAR